MPNHPEKTTKQNPPPKYNGWTIRVEYGTGLLEKKSYVVSKHPKCTANPNLSSATVKFDSETHRRWYIDVQYTDMTQGQAQDLATKLALEALKNFIQETTTPDLRVASVTMAGAT